MQRKVSRPSVMLGDSVQPAGQHVQFARHRHLQDQQFALVNQIGVGLGPAAELAVEAKQGTLTRGIDKKSVEKIQEAISSGSFDRPGTTKFLISHQDLLCHEEKPSPRSRLAGACLCSAREWNLLLEVLKVFLRIVQAVRMVDSHPIHVTLADEIEHQRVHRRKYFGILHPDCSQVVDVEEATVVDLIGGHTPETQAISLSFEQT